MDLSPELQKRFDAAASGQDTYQPSDDVRRTIADKTLVMIVAPAAMGKSYVISRTIQADARFAQTVSFSTRDPRAGDEGNMRTIPRDNEHIGLLLDRIESGQVVNYTVFPTTGMVYGTDLESYPGTINLMATLANSVDSLRHAGFGTTLTIGLVASLDTWRTWFDAKYPSTSIERVARLKEAKLSLEWLITQPSITWLINRENEADMVAHELVDIIRNNQDEVNKQAIRYATDITKYIADLLN